VKPDTAALRELRERLYQHVLDTIDWGALHGFEQVLWSMLPRLGYNDHDGQMAEQMVRACVIRAAADPMRNVSDVPFGITQAERRAASREDDCVFCQAEAACGDAHEPDVDDCPCCSDMAADWRAQHEAVLKKAGLWRPPPS